MAVAERAVRDYIATLQDLDEVDDDIMIVPELGARIDSEVAAARTHVRDAERIQQEAARESRRVVHELRRQGLSTTDVAVVLGVSRGRVSQLDKEARRASGEAHDTTSIG